MKISTLLDGTPIDETQFKQWIAALRSGEYGQSKESLQDCNGYCCLGVAVKILVDNPKQSFSNSGMLYGSFPEDHKDSPEWLKRIDDDFGYRKLVLVPADDFIIKLSRLNDKHNYTFTQIADLLDEHYVGKEEVV